MDKLIRAFFLGFFSLAAPANLAFAAVCSVNIGLIQPPDPDIQLNGVAGVSGLVIGVGEPTCDFAPNPCNDKLGVVYVNGVATPLPNNTAQLNGVSVASTNYAVAVGDEKFGTTPLAQFDGTTWTAMPTTGTEPSQDANGVKTYGPNQTYVVGDQGIYFFNGTTWTRQVNIGDVSKVNGQNADKFEAIWGDANNVYALADNGALYTTAVATPAAWTLITAAYPAGANKADFQAITGDAAGNVYVTGQTDNNKGFVYQYNPTTDTWTELITTTGKFDLNGIAINPVTGAITAVGDNGGQITSGPDGADPWTQIPEANNTNDINAVYIDSNGTTYLAGQTADGCTVPVTGPDHVDFVHDGLALTCTPKAVTVLGCMTATSCNGVPANQYTAGSFNVTLGAIAGATWCADSLCATTLANPATLSNGSVIYLKDANVRTDRMSGTVSSATNTAVQCVNTTNGAFNSTTACDVSFAASGFLVSLPNHVSCANSVLTVQAVQSNNNSTNCVPMFRNRTRDETISFAYSNPATGTLVPSVGVTALTGGSAAVSLTFDNSGIATPTFVYQDAGQLSVTVTDPILPMTGSVQAVVAPASFVFSGIPAAPLVAGQAFNATVTAMNACATPAVTPNFTNQTVVITSSNPQPGLGNATAIDASLIATSGTGSANLTWDEVGTIDLDANLPAYLGSALSISGTQAGVGRFHPAYFDTAVTPGCATFTYAGSTAPAKAGQPFTVTVTAKRLGGGVTANYAGAANAYLTTLSNAGVADGLASNTIVAADFANGVGSANVTYAVATPETAPLTLSMRATNADPTPVSSSGHAEGTANIRSGRAKLGNAHGSELLALPIPFRTEYWDSGWISSSSDSCTGNDAAGGTVSIALVAPGGWAAGVACVQDDGVAPGLSNSGCAAAGPVAQRFAEGSVAGFAGNFNLWLKAPGTNNTGAVTVTGSVPTWLQFAWGGGVVSNPTARATFGVYKGNNEFIYLRENY